MRVIVDIIYEHQRIYIKYVLTHAEYDKDKMFRYFARLYEKCDLPI